MENTENAKKKSSMGATIGACCLATLFAFMGFSFGYHAGHMLGMIVSMFIPVIPTSLILYLIPSIVMGGIYALGFGFLGYKSGQLLLNSTKQEKPDPKYDSLKTALYVCVGLIAAIAGFTSAYDLYSLFFSTSLLNPISLAIGLTIAAGAAVGAVFFGDWLIKKFYPKSTHFEQADTPSASQSEDNSDDADKDNQSQNENNVDKSKSTLPSYTDVASAASTAATVAKTAGKFGVKSTVRAANVAKAAYSAT